MSKPQRERLSRLPSIREYNLPKIEVLRKWCKYRDYDVVKYVKRGIILRCLKHGDWEETRARVVADTAECPDCEQTRPRGKGCFHKLEWKYLLKKYTPHYKYVDKRSMVYVNKKYWHKCLVCGTTFNKRIRHLWYSGATCSACGSEAPNRAAFVTFKRNLDGIYYRRDRAFECLDLMEAFHRLNKHGYCDYPPTIKITDAEVREHPIIQYYYPDNWNKAWNKVSDIEKPEVTKPKAYKYKEVKEPGLEMPDADLKYLKETEDIDAKVEQVYEAEPQQENDVIQEQIPKPRRARKSDFTAFDKSDESSTTDDKPNRADFTRHRRSEEAERDSEILDIKQDVVRELNVRVVDNVESDELVLADELDGEVVHYQAKELIQPPSVGVYMSRGGTTSRDVTLQDLRNNYGPDFFR